VATTAAATMPAAATAPSSGVMLPDFSSMVQKTSALCVTYRLSGQT
jgi:hypothetical protein